MAEARAVNSCTLVGYIKYYQKNEKSHPNRAWLWSRDLFKLILSAPDDISGTAKARDSTFYTVLRQVTV